MEAQRPAFAALALGFTTALALAVALRSAYAQLRADLDAVNAKLKVRKPALIILVRHGESEANVDSSKYRDVGDPHISLTERGQQQAHRAGDQLRELVGSRHVFAYVSPYARTRQTADLALSHLTADELRVVRRIEDPRLREREFCGTFQHEKPDRSDERDYSRFFWRPPSGESNADVYDRISSFLDTLWRDFRSHKEMEGAAVVIFGHGLTNRIFAMRWLHWSHETFSARPNMRNGDMLVMKRHRARRASNPASLEQRDYYRLTKLSLRNLSIDPLEPDIAHKCRTSSVVARPSIDE